MTEGYYNTVVLLKNMNHESYCLGLTASIEVRMHIVYIVDMIILFLFLWSYIIETTGANLSHILTVNN